MLSDRLTVLILASGGLAAAPGLCQAQARPAEDPAELAEVIVTAQNRAQDVNDVPIAIDVVSAEELQKAGFGSINDIQQIAPVVQLNQDQGLVKISVRGVGTTSNDEAQDTSVVVNVDGEYINRPQPLSVALFDMERVEVLRGPQGTLYGRNSTGGAINFITRKPGKELGANLSGSYGNYDAIRFDAGVDLPVGDSSGFRIAGFYDEHDGYMKHPARATLNIRGFNFPPFAGGRSDDNKSYGGRVSYRFEPGDALDINLSAEYGKREFTPQIFGSVDLNLPGNGPTGNSCNAPGFTQVAPAYAPSVLCVPSGTDFLSKVDRSTTDAPGFGLSLITQDTYALRGRFAYKLSDAATLTYVGGYRNFEGTPGQVIMLPGTYRSFNWDQQVGTNSHELRLNGEVGRLTYQVGGFYFKEGVNQEVAFVTTFGPNVVQLSYFVRDVNTESYSAFGQAEYALSDQFTLVGGLRYTDNARDAVYKNATPFGAGPPDPLLFNGVIERKNFSALRFGTTSNLDVNENKTTWLLGVNYKPNTDTLVYAKASTGFKGGGFDSVGDFRPETNTAFELGWKQTFGDSGQHQFNLTGFLYDYKDLQVSVLLDTAVGGQTFNAGKATISGLEAELNFGLSEDTRFNASVNYLDAKYDELLAQYAVFCVNCGLNGIGDLDPTTPGVQQPNLKGNRREYSPKMIARVGLDHDFTLGGAGKVTASVGSTFKSSYFTDFFNYRDGKQKSYTQTDLSLTYRPASEKYSVQAFARNLENERPLTYGSFVSAGPFDDVFNWQYGAPRTFGIRVGMDF